MGRTTSWQGAIVAHLLDSKRAGVPWQEARRLAAAAVQIPPRDVEASSLLEQHNTVASFFWKVVRDAYLDVVGENGSGNGPDLKYFGTEMIDVLDDVRLDPVAA